MMRAQDWYNLPKVPGPKGDYTADELALVKKFDVGVEGSGTAYVKSGDFSAALLKEGAKPMPNTEVLKPEAWAKKAGVTVVDSKVKDVYGTQTVLTNKGLQPAIQYEYWSYWKLEDKPRRMALLVEDMVEDYRIYVGYLVPKIQPLIKAFKDAGMPVFYSNWLRRPNDKIYGSLDRFYGPAGVKSLENPMYIYAKEGSYPMKELAPTDEEIKAGHMIHSAHLSKFADVTDDGKSYLREEMKEHGIDTLVVTGAWSEDCITATAFDAADTENLDVVIIEDGVGTATPGHYPALEVMKASVALVKKSEEVVKYVESHKGDEKYILKAEVFPKIYEAPTPAAAQTVVLTLPQLGFLVVIVMISSVGISMVIQRTIAQRSKKLYQTLAEDSSVQLEALSEA